MVADEFFDQGDLEKMQLKEQPIVRVKGGWKRGYRRFVPGDDGQGEEGRAAADAGGVHRRHLSSAVQGVVGDVPVDEAAVSGDVGEQEALAGSGGEGGDGAHLDRSRYH